jgi:hypothetical protein
MRPSIALLLLVVMASCASTPAPKLPRLVLPQSHEARRDEIAGYVVKAHRIIETFASEHGWSDRMRVFFERGVEIHATQLGLWQRILELHGQPRDRPLPVKGLAAALEKGVLLAVTPEEYRRVQPAYASKPGAYTRLLAHEIAHRLHVALVGDERMGPTWFFEGFAVVAAGDLLSEPVSEEVAWEGMRARGPGSYKKYAATLRYLMTRIPLPEMISKAGDKDFEAWLGRKLGREHP